MRRATGVLADPAISWDDIREEWDAAQFMLEFWDLSIGHTVTHHAGSDYPGEASELESIATYTLIEFANDWMEGRVVEAGVLQDRRLFWDFLKKRIGWAVADHRRTTRRDTTIDDDPDAWSNFLRARIDNRSMVNIALVQTMVGLRVGMRALLALAFYEQLPSASVEHLLRLGQGASSAAKRTACERLLETAVGLTATRKPEPKEYPDLLVNWRPTPEILEWLEERYQTRDLGKYLDHVATMWAIDASYMVDVLWFAHGRWHTSPTARPKLQIDPTVVAELTEARYAARMTQTEAARVVSERGVPLIQAHLSRFERSQAGLRPQTVDTLRAVYASHVPTGKKGGGRDPRRWKNDY